MALWCGQGRDVVKPRTLGQHSGPSQVKAVGHHQHALGIVNVFLCQEGLGIFEILDGIVGLTLQKDVLLFYPVLYEVVGHGLGAVDYVSHRIAVMYLGKIVELGESREIFDHPVHPYTRALLAALPMPDPRMRDKRREPLLEGEAGSVEKTEGKSAQSGMEGCPFYPRCPRREAACRTHRQELVSVDGTGRHLAACAPAAGGQQAAQTDALREEGRRP